MAKGYPNDCDDACPKTAKWDITFMYPPSYGEPRGRKSVMRACDEHKESVTRAARSASWHGEVNVSKHVYVPED